MMRDMSKAAAARKSVQRLPRSDEKLGFAFGCRFGCQIREHGASLRSAVARVSRQEEVFGLNVTRWNGLSLLAILKAGHREARDVVVVAMQGDYGKPRPALVIQSDLFNDAHSSVVVAPVTSTIIDAPLFRLTLESHALKRAAAVSQIMVDKVTAVRRDRIGKSRGAFG